MRVPSKHDMWQFMVDLHHQFVAWTDDGEPLTVYQPRMIFHLFIGAECTSVYNAIETPTPRLS